MLDWDQDLVLNKTFLNCKVQEEYQQTLIMQLRELKRQEIPQAAKEVKDRWENTSHQQISTRRISMEVSEEASAVGLEAQEIPTIYHISKIVRENKAASALQVVNETKKTSNCL